MEHRAESSASSRRTTGEGPKIRTGYAPVAATKNKRRKKKTRSTHTVIDEEGRQREVWGRRRRQKISLSFLSSFLFLAKKENGGSTGYTADGVGVGSGSSGGCAPCGPRACPRGRAGSAAWRATCRRSGGRLVAAAAAPGRRHVALLHCVPGHGVVAHRRRQVERKLRKIKKRAGAGRFGGKRMLLFEPRKSHCLSNSAFLAVVILTGRSPRVSSSPSDGVRERVAQKRAQVKRGEQTKGKGKREMERRKIGNEKWIEREKERGKPLLNFLLFLFFSFLVFQVLKLQARQRRSDGVRFRDADELRAVTHKWLEACQEALLELHAATREQVLSQGEKKGKKKKKRKKDCETAKRDTEWLQQSAVFFPPRKIKKALPIFFLIFFFFFFIVRSAREHDHGAAAGPASHSLHAGPLLRGRRGLFATGPGGVAQQRKIASSVFVILYCLVCVCSSSSSSSKAAAAAAAAAAALTFMTNASSVTAPFRCET
jgi:hypothetical protein